MNTEIDEIIKKKKKKKRLINGEMIDESIIQSCGEMMISLYQVMSFKCV